MANLYRLTNGYNASTTRSKNASDRLLNLYKLVSKTAITYLYLRETIPVKMSEMSKSLETQSCIRNENNI